MASICFIVFLFPACLDSQHFNFFNLKRICTEYDEHTSMNISKRLLFSQVKRRDVSLGTEQVGYVKWYDNKQKNMCSTRDVRFGLASTVCEWCGCFADFNFLLVMIHRDGNGEEGIAVVLMTYITIPHNISDTFEGAWAEWLGCFADLVFCSWLHVESHVVSFLRWSTQRETS